MPRACPDGWLKTYVYHQRHSEAPTSFHFWSGVSTIAGALRRKVWTDHKYYQYTPNFYILLVAPPGVATKSTTLRQGLDLLRKVRGINFGPQSLTWQALLDSIKQAESIVKIDATSSMTMSCVHFAISELGTFLRPENREYLDQLITLYDAQLGDVSRKTLGAGETIITNPWLNLIACTTPSWIRDNFPEVLVGGGLASRILFVYADKKQQLVPYPELLVQPEEFLLEEQCLIHDLKQIATIAGAYRLSETAYKWGVSWYQKINDTRPDHLTSERFAGYLARKQAHIHKLAMVLAASLRDERLIEEEDLVSAEHYVSALEENMRHVFDNIGVSQGAQVFNEILGRIRVAKQVQYRHLWNAVGKTVDPKVFKDTIQNALEAGVIRREPLQGGDWMLYYIPPKERQAGV